MAVCAIGYIGGGLALLAGKTDQIEMTHAAIAGAALLLIGEIGLWVGAACLGLTLFKKRKGNANFRKRPATPPPAGARRVIVAEDAHRLARDGRGAPEVDVHEPPRGILGHGLDFADEARGGVVEDGVDAPEVRDGGPERGADVVGARDVNGADEERVGGVLRGEVGEGCGVAEGRDDFVAFGEEQLAHGEPEAGGRARH